MHMLARDENFNGEEPDLSFLQPVVEASPGNQNLVHKQVEDPKDHHIKEQDNMEMSIHEQILEHMKMGYMRWKITEHEYHQDASELEQCLNSYDESINEIDQQLRVIRKNKIVISEVDDENMEVINFEPTANSFQSEELAEIPSLSATNLLSTFDDEEILREIELFEIDDNDLLDEEELLKELGIFDIADIVPSSPDLSISTSINQVGKPVQELQVVQSVNNNLLIQSFPVKHDTTMVMVTMIIQLGIQQLSHLIPIVMYVAVSIWGYHAFKIFDPGGQ